MNTATIVAQYLNPPKPGRKTGSVKDADGQYWDIWPDKMAQMQQGGTYQIEYETREYNGKTYCTIKSIVGGQAPAPKANGMNGAAKPANGNGYGGKNDEQIFVMAILKSGIEAGHVTWDRGQIADTIKTLRTIYSETFGGAH